MTATAMIDAIKKWAVFKKYRGGSGSVSKSSCPDTLDFEKLAMQLSLEVCHSTKVSPTPLAMGTKLTVGHL